MNIDTKSVHFDLTDEAKEYLETKALNKTGFASDLIVDLLFTLTKEKNEYKIEVNINFKRNNSHHISVQKFDMYEGIDILMDKIEKKVRREKEKIKDH
jgi:putative sigma-54 modulation protein